MEVFLYNSTVCRLCGEENDCGNLLYSCEENNQTLSELINTYLPIKVEDDGILPRTVCPGCTIQLEATVEFINLIINGQKVIRELHQREKEYKKTVFSENAQGDIVTKKIIYEINTDNGVYQVEHPISLQVAGLERPKRKRGRPPKKTKTPEELALEAEERERELQEKKQIHEEEPSGKRRRKTPTRFKEAVQGKELERIFKEEGVIDDESEVDVKPDAAAVEQPPPREPEVIGHMEDSGELVVVVKGKGRGRPKGRVRQTKEECAICGMEFSCIGRYMSHIAQHGPVVYQCAQCGHAARTLIQHQAHQKDTAHQGQVCVPHKDEPTDNSEVSNEGSRPPSAPKDPLALDPQLTPSMPLLQDEEPDADGDSEKPEKPDDESLENVTVIGPKGKVRLKCNHCDKTFGSKQSKSMHIKAVHKGEKPYECAECGCKFAYPRSLALHAISHRRRTSAKRYACDLCGKVLNHPSSVVYHKEAEHAGRAWVCGQCGKSFKHRQLLQRHQLVHSQARPHTCKICNAAFKTKANLLNHQLLHSGVKKFSCNLCNHKFAHKTSLTLHMRWHTGSKPFGCKTCGKSFSQRGNLSEHERIHTGEKPYQCAQCPRRFTTSSQYRLHARRHQPDKPYACSHCPKRFVSRGSWLAHRRRAAGVRAHHCAVCARSFAERWALRKHMRRHTGERPFACKLCPRAFADCSNLNKHRKQVHKLVSLLNKDTLPAAPSPAATTQDSECLTIDTTDLGAEPDEAEANAVNGTTGEASDSESEGVIYVTYDVDGPGTAFTIMEPDEAESLEAAPQSPPRMYTTADADGALLVPPELQTSLQPGLQPGLPLAVGLEPLVAMDNESAFAETISVTDEQGNPLHFTMQDGTRLAITSADGQSLQVITQDGQTIPVEINEYNEDEEVEDEGSDTVMHQMNLQKTISVEPGTHYFTIL